MENGKLFRTTLSHNFFYGTIDPSPSPLDTRGLILDTDKNTVLIILRLNLNKLGKQKIKNIKKVRLGNVVQNVAIKQRFFHSPLPPRGEKVHLERTNLLKNRHELFSNLPLYPAFDSVESIPEVERDNK